MVEPNIRQSLGEGLVDFWKDRWLYDEPLCTILGRLDVPHFLVSEFFAGDVWNEQRLTQWVPVHMVHAIKNVCFQID